MQSDEGRKCSIDYEEKYMMGSSDNEMDMIHVHAYCTETDVADGHQHMFMGVSGPARTEGRSHVHHIRIRTSFTAEDCSGHWHWVDIMSDRAVAMPNGTHTHYYAGRTSMDDGHCHTFLDVTNLGPDMCMDDEEEEECIPIQKSCKYKYKRPEDEEYN
jgi:hypothetical protein